MKYFAAFLPMLDPEKSEQYRPQHLAYLDRMGREGKIFAKGRFPDGAGGLVIYIADSLEEAKTYCENDPYVLHGARSYEVHEWEMTVVGEGKK
ncbi:hypothetical protein BSNK01_04190 [Bacillaceae bacterium]